MRAFFWPVSIVGSVVSALRYEFARLRGVRSMRGVVLSALTLSVLITLPAARQMIGHASGLASQHTPMQPMPMPMPMTSTQLAPMQPTAAWVIAGGAAGMVLPGIVAALGAAWFGATSVRYEYRYGSGLLTFAAMPRRGSVLVAKVVVAAGFGALLCPVTRAVAYVTARVGFQVAGEQVALPVGLLAPGPREVALAALGGALGVFAGATLRARVLAAMSALAGCALVAAFLPQSSSPAVPYLAEAGRFVVRVVPALTYRTVSDLLLGLPLATLALAGLIAVRRRRVA